MGERWGPAERERGVVGATATLVEAGDAGRTGWVLADSDAGAGGERVLGAALAWAGKHHLDSLHLIVDAGAAAGVLARQAALFARPELEVWTVDGRSLAVAAPAPVALPAAAPAPPELVDLLIDAGLEIVVEGGIVRGEVDGLEVARIVHGEATGGEAIDAPRLEVGVGKADRELTAAVHSGLPAVDQLGRVVEIVRRTRRAGVPRHPLNQLVPDRWLRAVLCREPGLVGLQSLRPAEGARARPNLSERDVAVAEGRAPDGSPVVVACTVGIAVDLVPAAADARASLDARREAEAGAAPVASAPSALMLVVPERDDHPAIRRLAGWLRSPATVVPLADDWRTAGGPTGE